MIGAPTRERQPLPPKGYVYTYLCTSAQNNTDVHPALWENLKALAVHDKAEILVAGWTYNTTGQSSIGQKKVAEKSSTEARDDSEWWAPEVLDHISNESLQLAPGLVWCGELNILATAVNPISGMESYTGRDSTIIPHAKIAMASVASPKASGCKFIYTTGTVTKRNYIQKKAGQKASFHHGYGALIVEVCDDGAWFCRQINADSEGVLYDLDRKVDAGKVTAGHRPEALAWGDIHARQLDQDMATLGWGAGGILDTLRPRRQVLHDLLDFRSANHHDRDDPWKTFAKHRAGQSDVGAEVNEAAVFLQTAARPWCDTVVVRSNHDEAMVRWLKEADFREDPENAEFFLDTTRAAYSAMRRGDSAWDPIAWALTQAGAPKRTRFLRRDESYIVCPTHGGGIELGMHGDIGANGSRGTLLQFARTGRKCIVGHSHSAGIFEGAYQVGVTARLDQGYNVGQSSWSHTHCIVYPNGKRAMITVWKGRWRG